MGEMSEQAIRERAYQIWQREGCPHGRDFEHWVQAQVELAAPSRGNGGIRSAVAPPRPSAPVSKPGSPAAGKLTTSGPTRGRRNKKA